MDLAHNHWQLGEKYAAKGHYLESLLHYERAKALSDTSSANYKKYSDSHGRVVNILRNNPVLTLQLQRGFTKRDVRRAYRRIVLVYHPDKNSDCDTSAIFTIIQSAYETLVASAPDETKSDALPVRHREMKKPKEPFRENSAPPSSEVKVASSAESPSGANSSSQNRNHDKPSNTESRHSAVHTLSTEELRERVRRLNEASGGRGLESMTRGELMREYLQHLRRETSKVSPSGEGSEEGDSQPKGRRRSAQEENRYLSQWMDAIRSVLGR